MRCDAAATPFYVEAYEPICVATVVDPIGSPQPERHGRKPYLLYLTWEETTRY